MEEAHIRGRRHAYFYKFLNGDGDMTIVSDELDHFVRHYFGYCGCINVEEVVWVMRKMSSGRAAGPNMILVEFYESTGRVGLEWLTALFYVIFRITRMT